MPESSRVHLESSAISGDFQLHLLRGFEAIEKFFEFEIELISTSQTPLDEDSLLATPATLVFTRGDQTERRIYGVVHSVRDFFLTEARNLGYAMTFAPRAWPMMQSKRSEIFLDVAVPDIIKTKLQRAGLDLGADADFRLLATYPTREFVMQYEETDLEFCSRLCEHLGISFFFEHQSGKDVIVFSDDNSGFSPIEGDASIPFSPRGEQQDVFAIEGRTKTIPAKYYLKDYNYRTPTVALVAQSDVDPAGRGDVIEYGAHFKTPDEGNQIAAIRADELRATKRVFSGKSEVPRIASGAKLKLDGHPRVEGELLVTEVRHEATQATGSGARGDERSYTNEFRAILASVTYRPPRLTPKPRVHGAITGVVEAVAPSQYSELDDQGRYHVRFMLDQGSAPQGKASSLLRMAQPHAGPGYGFHFPLRHGVEVMLTCIDGDPDRPIITGAVPNPTTPSTVGSNNGQHNVIRTGGGMEMNLDDTEGSTRFKLSVPFANSFLQLGAPNSAEPGFNMETDQQATINAGQSITIEAGTEIAILADGGDLTQSASAAVGISAEGGQMNLSASAGVFIAGNPTFHANATASTMQGGATATTTAPVTKTEGTALLELAGGAIINEHSGVLLLATAPLVIVKGDGLVSIISPGLISISAPTINVTGGTVVNVSAPTVNVTGASVATVSAPTVNVTGSGAVNIGSGVISINGSVVKLNT